MAVNYDCPDYEHCLGNCELCGDKEKYESSSDLIKDILMNDWFATETTQLMKSV